MSSLETLQKTAKVILKKNSQKDISTAKHYSFKGIILVKNLPQNFSKAPNY